MAIQDIGDKPAWAVYQDMMGNRSGWSNYGQNTGVTYNAGGGGATGGTAGQSLGDLTAQYLKNIPGGEQIQSNPEALYESQMGPIRRDIGDRINQTGLNLQSISARTGQNYGDLMARYLPEAFKPMGQAAAASAGQAQQMAQQASIAKTSAEQQRYQMATSMAQVDQMMQWEKQKFYDQLKFQAEQLEKELQSRYRMAMAQAQSAQQQQMIAQNFAMERERLAQQMQWQTTQFTQAQQNWRASQQMQLYEKYYGNAQNTQAREDIMRGSALWQGATKEPNIITPTPREEFYQDESGTWRQVAMPPNYYDVGGTSPYYMGGYGQH